MRPGPFSALKSPLFPQLFMFFGPKAAGTRWAKNEDFRHRPLARPPVPTRPLLASGCMPCDPHAGAGASLACATGFWSTDSVGELPFKHFPRSKPWEHRGGRAKGFFCQNDPRAGPGPHLAKPLRSKRLPELFP